MYHGSAPGRWIQKGGDRHTFEHGCFLSSQPRVASLYAADWATRSDRHEFIQDLVRGELDAGINDSLEIPGFLDFFKKNRAKYKKIETAFADFALENLSDSEIAHYIVQPNLYRSLYPDGAVIFPVHVKAEEIEIIDAKGANWESVCYSSTRFLIDEGEYSTNKIVSLLRGHVGAVWIKNVIDMVHAVRYETADTMFVYSPEDLAFTLTGKFLPAENHSQ